MYDDRIERFLGHAAVAEAVRQETQDHEARMHVPTRRPRPLAAVPFPEATIPDTTLARMVEMLETLETRDFGISLLAMIFDYPESSSSASSPATTPASATSTSVPTPESLPHPRPLGFSHCRVVDADRRPTGRMSTPEALCRGAIDTPRPNDKRCSPIHRCPWVSTYFFYQRMRKPCPRPPPARLLYKACPGAYNWRTNQTEGLLALSLC